MTDNRKIMSIVAEDARRILEKMEATQELHEKQLEMYKELVNNSISHHKERMDAFEKRWAVTRNLLIGVLTIFLFSFVSDKMALRSRPTNDDIAKLTGEYVTKEEVLRAFGSALNDTYDTFQILGVLDTEAVTSLRKDAKMNVIEQIDPNYRTRGLKIE